MTNKPLTPGGQPPRVLFPLKPFDDEGALGLIRRTAAWNHMPPIAVLRAAGVSAGFGPTHLAARAEELAACLGLPLRDFEQRLIVPLGGRKGPLRYFDLTLSWKSVNVGRPRVSPAALEISPHHRAIWHISALTFCTETWQTLIERCPKCSAEISWLWPTPIEICGRCGFDLRQAKTDLVASELRPALAIMAGLLSHDEQVRQASAKRFPPDFQHLSPPLLFELCLHLGRCSIEGRPHTQTADRNLPPAVLARGCSIALEYPSSFARLAAAHSDNQTIAPFFSRLAPAGALEGNRELRDLVASLVTQHEPVRHGPRRLKTLREDADRVCLTQVARTLGVESGTVRTLVNAGAFEGPTGRGQQRSHRWFSPESVEHMRERLSKRISAVEFQRQFGMPYEGVEQLASVGLLSVLADDAVRIAYPGLQLERHTVLEFVANVMNSVVPRGDDRMISLRDAFTAIGGRQKPWAAVLKAALDNSLPQPLSAELGASSKIEDLLITDQLAWDLACGRYPELLDVPARIPSLGPGLPMSRLEVERHLNCYPRDVSWLIAHGHLHSAGGMRGFCPEKVEALGLTLISSREISWRWRVSPELREALPSDHGINRVLGPFWPRQPITEHFMRMFPQGRPI